MKQTLHIKNYISLDLINNDTELINNYIDPLFIKNNTDNNNNSIDIILIMIFTLLIMI